MDIDWGVINKHQQITQFSCIPSAVEMILKFHQKVGEDYYGLQEKWGNNSVGDFRSFDGETIEGLTFKIAFDDRNYHRGSHFPLGFIDKELDEGRCLIISLPSMQALPLGFLFGGFHIWVIYGKTDKDFLAFTKQHVLVKEGQPLQSVTGITDEVKRFVSLIQGTDILTYREG
jgi:hypothetical protein